VENEDYIGSRKECWNSIVFTPFYGEENDEKTDKRAPTDQKKRSKKSQKLFDKPKKGNDEKGRTRKGATSEDKNKNDKLVMKEPRKTL